MKKVICDHADVCPYGLCDHSTAHEEDPNEECTCLAECEMLGLDVCCVETTDA